MPRKRQDEELDYKQELASRIAELYKQLQSRYGINITQLANALSINQSTLHLYKSARIMPTLKVLSKLHELYNVNLNWLITGKGEVFLQSTQPEEKEKEKRYLVGGLLKKLEEHLDLNRAELLDLTPFTSELELLYVEDNRIDVPESRLIEITETFGLREDWYKIKFLLFATTPTDLTRLDVDFLRKFYSGIVFATECPSDDKFLLFALWLRDKNKIYAGKLLYDTTDYAVWNWTDDPLQKVCHLKKLLQVCYERGFSLKLLPRPEYSKLVEGRVHPLRAEGITSNLLKELEEKSIEDYEQFRGKPSYGLAKLIVEYLYKC